MAWQGVGPPSWARRLGFGATSTCRESRGSHSILARKACTDHSTLVGTSGATAGLPRRTQAYETELGFARAILVPPRARPVERLAEDRSHLQPTSQATVPGCPAPM